MNNIPLNIDWQQILLHFFNFSILVGGLYLLLFKPVKSFMAKREKHYADMESAAQEREKSTADLEAAMRQREAEFDAALEEKRAAAEIAAAPEISPPVWTVSDEGVGTAVLVFTTGFSASENAVVSSEPSTKKARHSAPTRSGETVFFVPDDFSSEKE